MARETREHYLKAVDVVVEVSVYEKVWKPEAHRANGFSNWNEQDTTLGTFEVTLDLEGKDIFKGWVRVLTEHVQNFISNDYPNLGHYDYVDGGFFYDDDDKSKLLVKMWMPSSKHGAIMVFGEITELLRREWVGDASRALIPF